MKSKLLSASIKAALFGGAVFMSMSAQAHVVYPQALFNDTGTNPVHNTAGSNLTAPGTGTQTFAASSNVGWYAGSTTGLAQASADWNTYRTNNGGIPAGATGTINGSNSHDNKFLYFALSQEYKVTFDITANNTTSGQTGTGLFIPAFSIYSGLAPFLAHDGAVDNATTTSSVLALDANGFAPFSNFLGESPVTGAGNKASLWGAYRSDATFGMGNDMDPASTAVNNYPNGDPINGFHFNTLNLVGYATNTGLSSGTLSHSGGANTVSATFDLQPGAYTLTVGGNDSSALDPYMAALIGSIGLPVLEHTLCAPLTTVQCTGLTDAVAQARSTFGFNITTTVQPVPLPAAVWLFGSALAGLTAVGRRKTAVNA